MAENVILSAKYVQKNVKQTKSIDIESICNNNDLINNRKWILNVYLIIYNTSMLQRLVKCILYNYLSKCK